MKKDYQCAKSTNLVEDWIDSLPNIDDISGLIKI